MLFCVFLFFPVLPRCAQLLWWFGYLSKGCVDFCFGPGAQPCGAGLRREVTFIVFPGVAATWKPQLEFFTSKGVGLKPQTSPQEAQRERSAFVARKKAAAFQGWAEVLCALFFIPEGFLPPTALKATPLASARQARQRLVHHAGRGRLPDLRRGGPRHPPGDRLIDWDGRRRPESYPLNGFPKNPSSDRIVCHSHFPFESK